MQTQDANQQNSGMPQSAGVPDAPDNSNMPNQIPVPPAAPSAPAVQANQPTAQPRPAQPAQQPPTPKSLHASIFEGVLKNLGGGTQYINRTDPTTGAVTREPIQQTKGQLGKSILAGALAGMFGGMGARDAEGRHDPVKAAQEGFEAGSKPMEQKVAALQQAADADTANRQMVMKNNMDLMHQQIAMTHMQHQELQTTADNNNKGILADADVYDKGLSGTDVNDKTKQAIQGRGLTYQEALAKLQGNWSNTLAIVDGYQDVRGPNGEMEPEPTYAVLNPNVTIKMSADQAAAMATFKPSYQNAFDQTGGNLKIPLSRYVADVHQLNSLNQAEAYFENVKAQIPELKNAPDLAALARDPKNGQQVLSAVQDVENAIGQGGDPVAVLQRLSGTGGGALILKDMGVTNDQVQTLVNSKIAAQQELLNKNPGKKPVDLVKIQGLPTLAASLGLDKPQTAAALAKVPTTVDEYDTVVGKMQDQANKNREFAAGKEKESGNPKDIDTLSDQLLQPNNLMSMRDVGTRGTQREAIIAEASRKAKAQGIPFDPGLINERIDFVKSYFDPKGKDSGNRRSLNNLVQHSGNLSELDHGVESRAANTAMNAIESQFGNEAYQKFLTETAVVKDEVTNYFAGGFAPNMEQKKTWEKILANDATPNQIESFVKTIIPEAAIRLDSTAEQFKEVMGYDDPNLVHPATKVAAQKLGLDKVFAKYKSGGQLSQNLPATQPYTPAAGDRPINKGGKVVGYLSADGTRHNL